MDLIIVDLKLYNYLTRPSGLTVRRNYITDMHLPLFLKVLNTKLENIKKESQAKVEAGHIGEDTVIRFNIVSVVELDMPKKDIKELTTMDATLILAEADDWFSEITLETC